MTEHICENCGKRTSIANSYSSDGDSITECTIRIPDIQPDGYRHHDMEEVVELCYNCRIELFKAIKPIVERYKGYIEKYWQEQEAK